MLVAAADAEPFGRRHADSAFTIERLAELRQPVERFSGTLVAVRRRTGRIVILDRLAGITGFARLALVGRGRHAGLVRSERRSAVAVTGRSAGWLVAGIELAGRIEPGFERAGRIDRRPVGQRRDAGQLAERFRIDRQRRRERLGRQQRAGAFRRIAVR